MFFKGYYGNGYYVIFTKKVFEERFGIVRIVKGVVFEGLGIDFFVFLVSFVDEGRCGYFNWLLICKYCVWIK